MSDNRRAKRYSTPEQAPVNFYYDFMADLEVHPSGKPIQYKAIAKNVSVEGLCFTSEQQLRVGEILNLEYFVPGYPDPIHMQGRVRWSQHGIQGTDIQDPAVGFDTGVLLTTIEGEPVHESIHYDNNYHVYWSNVLEKVLGKFRIVQQEKRRVA